MDLEEAEVTLQAYDEKYATETNFKTITNVPELHRSTSIPKMDSLVNQPS